MVLAPGPKKGPDGVIMELIIRKGYASDWDDAMELAWRTFLEFNAADYSVVGQENFKKFLFNPELYQQYVIGNYDLIVAFDSGTMVGTLLLRENRHISLLFVDGSYHGKGIGHKLIECASKYVRKKGRRFKMSVNASRYAVPFYKHEGFKEAEIEQFEDGIRYLPMELKL